MLFLVKSFGKLRNFWTELVIFREVIFYKDSGRNKFKKIKKFLVDPKTIAALREKCPYSEFFWSVFSRIRTESGEMPQKQSTGGILWKNCSEKFHKIPMEILESHISKVVGCKPATELKRGSDKIISLCILQNFSEYLFLEHLRWAASGPSLVRLSNLNLWLIPKNTAYRNNNMGQII